jgi:NADH:ubiquinone oxidoreductase subunit D
MLTKLAIWYLRSKGVSIIMNCKLEDGKVQQLRSTGFTYDSHFKNVEYRLIDDSLFDIPEGKFNITKPMDTNLSK